VQAQRAARLGEVQFTHGFVALSYSGEHVTSEAGQAWERFKEAQGELKHFELALRSMLGGYPRREEGQSAADYLRSLPDTLGSQVRTRDVSSTFSCLRVFRLLA